MQHVFPFLNDKENVIDLDNVIFVHDKAPCMRANMTQHLIRDSSVKFWGNDMWPSNLPDLNVTEHVGSIIKEEVEKQMLLKTEHNRYREDKLKKHIANVLTDTENDTELFEALLCSSPSRLRAVKSVNGRHTDF